MPIPWTLVITTPSRITVSRIGGLNPLLRLALDAQRAGAAAVVIEGNSPEQKAQLSDRRLGIPVVAQVPPQSLRVEVPAHWVIHRQTFSALKLDERTEGSTVVVPQDLCPDTMYAFAPIAVVDAASARLAERLLFRSLRKAEDGWTARWLNRYISLAISRWLAKTPILPNQLSVFILAIGLFGAWLASRGTYGSLLAGATLFQTQSILDGCDGELSRVTYRGSHLGEWLDTVGDDLTNYSFFVGAALGLFSSSGSSLYLIIGAIMLLSGLLASGLEYRYLIRIGSGDLLKYPLSQATSKREGKFGWITPFFKRDTFVFLTWCAAVASFVEAVLVLFTIGAVGVLVSVVMTEVRLSRERKAPTTP